MMALFKNEDICFFKCVLKKHSKHLARWYVSPAASVRYAVGRGTVEAGPIAAVETNFTYRGIEKSRKMKFETENSLRRFNIFFSKTQRTTWYRGSTIVEPSEQLVG